MISFFSIDSIITSIIVDIQLIDTKVFKNNNITYLSDFSLSGDCFGTDIIQKCTKWFQIGVHGLKIGQIFAKFQCVSFLI